MSRITKQIISDAIASRSYKQPAASQKDARDLQISVDGMSFGLTTGNNTGGVSQNLYFDADASKVLLSFLKDLLKESKKLGREIETPIQSIFFGAPGTGKSFKIDDSEKGFGLKNVPESHKFRTTFHPDYDYAQFVGAYKPKKEGDAITYSFVPQVFAKAYAAAWKLYLDAKGDSRLRGNDDKNGENDSGKDIQVYLVIEEINRGNCAQIFGDIFQLLDRVSDSPDKGFSQYSIDADCDFAEWLKKDSILQTVWSEYETKVGDGKLKLPPNLNILATMNTSDQSLFPMDSAFKRRFDWEYVPISFEGKDAANYKIDIDGSLYSWQNFVETVNEKILDLTESEDKQLGEFFIKPDSGDVISKERFLGKVMFYLWNEVCKDEHKNGSFFRAKINDKEDFFTFQDLYKKKDLLKLFMDGLLAPKN
jgi:5-methylcytosine-specific restriction endonuclease McrBC GTP-binding regulatory subunit McrB